ncbi:hypothetical protein H5T58_00125 [Candidatus Parcubacteria bacterium]|nr:hypothetical protein [Candidatus Parcubacteria bacterium]
MERNFHFPYYHIRQEKEDLIVFRFLKRKFLPPLKRTFKIHYLFNQDIREYLNFIKQTGRKYPFFLAFDVEKYYPSISHQILLKELPEIYQKISKKSLSRRLKKVVKKDLPSFLSRLPIKNYSLPIGNPLSFFLAGIYTLSLDLSLPCPFLRYCDDYLLFSKSKKNLEEILSKIILPHLEKLNLKLNFSKIQSGRFNIDKLSFLGFEFIGGYIRISPKGIENFKKKIVKITRLNKKKEIKAVIKQLNNQILGFSHYFKFANSNNVFKELDSFCRARLRRYILRNRDLFPKTSNLLFSNQALKELGLKSLLEIKQNFDQKFNKKFKKSGKRKKKVATDTGLTGDKSWEVWEKVSLKYVQNQILKELQKLTSLVKKLQKKIGKMERKLDKFNF